MAVKKKTFAMSLDVELIEWINKEWERREFRNKSHFVESIIKNYKYNFVEEKVVDKVEETIKT